MVSVPTFSPLDYVFHAAAALVGQLLQQAERYRARRSTRTSALGDISAQTMKKWLISF